MVALSAATINPPPITMVATAANTAEALSARPMIARTITAIPAALSVSRAICPASPARRPSSLKTAISILQLGSPRDGAGVPTRSEIAWGAPARGGLRATITPGRALFQQQREHCGCTGFARCRKGAGRRDFGLRRRPAHGLPCPPLCAVHDVMDGDRPPQALQGEGAHLFQCDEVLDRNGDPLAQQNLPVSRLGAQARGEIGDRADRGIGHLLGETDWPERRISLRNADAETEIEAAPAP